MTAQSFDHERLDVVQDDAAMKAMLHRIVSMLTRMAMKFDGVAESIADYDAAIDYDYDYEHRFAEHEHGRQKHARTSGYIGMQSGLFLNSPSPVCIR